MKKLLTLLFVAAISVASYAAAGKYELSSPNGRISAKINVSNGISYELFYDDVQLLTPSRIAMTLADGTAFDGKGGPQKTSRRVVDQTIRTTIYRNATVKDNFNEITLKYKKFSVIFRAYNDGIAYRFVSNVKTPFKVASETAQFSFAEDWTSYVPYANSKKEKIEEQFGMSFENQYAVDAISKMNPAKLAFAPLLVTATDGIKVLVTEADNYNYPGLFLLNRESGTCLEGVFATYPKTTVQGGHNNLQGVVTEREDFIAKFDNDASFPWRTVIVAGSDIELAASDMVYRLATPQKDGSDFSWVKPGKVAWDWWNDWNLYSVKFKAGINTETYKYYIDFASANNIEYVILDEGWAVNGKADLFDIIPEIDLQELASYSKSRNVGLILWAGYLPFERDMEKVCEHYSKMGIKGFKVDFMDRDDQYIMQFNYRAAEMTAKYGLLLDLHGTSKPVGLNRTFPNVVNFEGVAGLEQMKWQPKDYDQVTYDVIIPFIRMVAGPMDYTQGAMRNAAKGKYFPSNSEPMSQGTRCRQLAEYIVFDAPLTMMCDSPSNYIAEKECTTTIASIPTSWDETVFLSGEVGKYIAVARRKGDVWYLGVMTDWNARKVDIDMSCIAEGGYYMMETFSDGPNAVKAGRDYKRESVELPAKRKFTVEMAPGGGFYAKITKSN